MPQVYQAIIEPAEEGGFLARTPNLPGVTQGETEDEAQRMLQDMIATILNVSIDSIHVERASPPSSDAQTSSPT